MAVVGDAWVRVRVFSAGLSGDIADNVRQQLRGSDRAIDREGERTGGRIGDAISRGIRNNSRGNNGIGSMALRLAKQFGDDFNLGIGRARMGRGIISVLAAITPSVAAAGAAMATALVSEIVTVISAIGPGLLGLGATLGAGLATGLLNFGLLAAAFKSGAEGLEELKKETQALFEELGRPVAEGMLGGLRESVSILRGSLPEINDLLRTTGERFGEIAKGAAETLTSTENISRLRSILSTNIEFLTRFRNGFNDLITAFLILLDAAKPFIDYLGEGLERFGAWAKSILEAKEASGELGESAQRLLDRWKLLWETVKDFGSGVLNIFEAIRPLGEKLAQSFADTAENFRLWTEDPANQERILQFFTKANELSSKIFETLGKLFSAGGSAFLEADFTNLFAVMDSIANVLGPNIARIFNQIQEGIGPHLVAVVENLGIAFGKIADNEILGKAAELVGQLLEKISELVATDVGSWVLGLGAAWLLFGGIIKPIVSLLGGLLGALGSIGVAIAAAVGFFVLMWQNSEQLREKIGELVTVVGGKFTEIWDKISPKLATAWENIQELAGVIGDRLAPIIEQLTPIISSFLTIVGTVLDFVVTHIGEFIGLLADLLSGDFEGAWEHAKAIVGNFVDFIKNLFPQLLEFLGSIWEGIENLVVGVWDSIWAKGEEWAGNISVWWTNLWTTVTTAFHAIWDPIQAWWVSLWETIGAAFTIAWDYITAAAQGLWSALVIAFHFFWDPIVNAWNTIWLAVETVFTVVWGAIQAAASAIWQALVTAYHAIIDPIVAWWQGVWENVKAAAITIWTAIVGTATTIWNTIKAAIETIVSVLASTLEGWWNTIKAAVETAWNGLSAIVSGIWTAISDAIWMPIKNAYDTVVGWIEDIKTAVSGALEWLGTKVTEANAALESVLQKQAEATVAGTAIGGGAGLGTTTYLAEGGIVPAIPGGWNVVIGEGGRDERVEPLDSSGLSRRDRAMIARIVGEMTSNTTSGGDTIVKVLLDGRELTGIIQGVVSSTNRAIAKDANRRRRVYA